MSDSGPPAAPNDRVMWSMATDPVPGRESVSRLNTDRLSSSVEGVGPCEDVLLRALEPENRRLRGLVTLLRRGSIMGDDGAGSVSRLDDGCADDEPFLKPGIGGIGTRAA